MNYDEIYDAILDGEIDVLQKGVINGTDFHYITGNYKWTYLHKAFLSLSERVPVKSVQFLLNQGLNVNAVDSYGNTPLIYAVRQRNVEGVRLLLENGADKLIEHENQDGVSALRMVFLNKPNCYDIVKLLLEFDASPDTKNKNGKTVRERLQVIVNVDPKIHKLFEQY